MTNLINLQLFLLLIFWNHLMTVDVFLHWQNFVILLISLIISSRYILLTHPIPRFGGLINLHLVFYLKFSLWSFMVFSITLSLCEISCFFINSGFIDVAFKWRVVLIWWHFIYICCFVCKHQYIFWWLGFV